MVNFVARFLKLLMHKYILISTVKKIIFINVYSQPFTKRFLLGLGVWGKYVLPSCRGVDPV